MTDLFPTLLSMAVKSCPRQNGAFRWRRSFHGMESRVKDGPRKELVYNIDPLGLAAVASSFMTGGQGGFGKDRSGLTAEDMTRRATSGNIPEKYAAIRVGKYKLITGQPDGVIGTALTHPLSGKRSYIMGPDVTDYDLLETGGPFGDMRLGDGGQAKIKRKSSA